MKLSAQFTQKLKKLTLPTQCDWHYLQSIVSPSVYAYPNTNTSTNTDHRTPTTLSALACCVQSFLFLWIWIWIWTLHQNDWSKLRFWIL